MKKEAENARVMLLEKDQPGRFALIPVPRYNNRVEYALEKLFNKCTRNIKQVEKSIVFILLDADFEKEAKAVDKEKRSFCSKNFLVKDHEEGYL